MRAKSFIVGALLACKAITAPAVAQTTSFPDLDNSDLDIRAAELVIDCTNGKFTNGAWDVLVDDLPQLGVIRMFFIPNDNTPYHRYTEEVQQKFDAMPPAQQAMIERALKRIAYGLWLGAHHDCKRRVTTPQGNPLPG